MLLRGQVVLNSSLMNFQPTSRQYRVQKWNICRLCDENFQPNPISRFQLEIRVSRYWQTIAYISTPLFEHVNPNGRKYSLGRQCHHQKLAPIEVFQWWQNNQCSHNAVTATICYQFWEEWRTDLFKELSHHDGLIALTVQGYLDTRLNLPFPLKRKKELNNWFRI